MFSQLYIGGKNEGVHALICQIRDSNGKICPGVRIADCGLKIGLNGVDNGRLWYAVMTHQAKISRRCLSQLEMNRCDCDSGEFIICSVLCCGVTFMSVSGNFLPLMKQIKENFVISTFS